MSYVDFSTSDILEWCLFSCESFFRVIITGKDVVYFGAAHPGGFNGVYADGSVHTLSYAIDVVLFNSLATRAGDEVVDEKAVN